MVNLMIRIVTLVTCSIALVAAIPVHSGCCWPEAVVEGVAVALMVGQPMAGCTRMLHFSVSVLP